jgi:hypothetical protein
MFGWNQIVGSLAGSDGEKGCGAMDFVELPQGASER